MLFKYRGRDAEGKTVSGSIKADNQRQAVRELQRRGISITFCRGEIASSIQGLRFFRRAVSRRDLAIFCRQLGTMLRVGVPIISALNILHVQITNNNLRQGIVEIRRDLEKGEALSCSLSKRPNIFPIVLVHTAEAGEISGALDNILHYLAGHLEREYRLEEKVKSALIYPAVVSGVALLTIIFLFYYVLPVFQTMLIGMQVPLPWLTRLVLWFSQLLQQLWPFLLFVLAGVMGGFYYWYRQPQGRLQIDRLLLRLPVLGLLRHKVILSRFSRTLGTLLHCGVPLLAALDAVRRAIGNTVMAEGVEQVSMAVQEGSSLAESLAVSGLFSPMVIEMVAVGEVTGSLDTLLATISDFYDYEVGEIVSRLSSLIEPALIVLLGGIVGLIVLSVLLPVFAVYSGIQ